MPAAWRKACSKASCSATSRAPSPTPRWTASGRFELADGGTLFLDEIANVPLNLQAKMLRVLEIGEMERVGSSKTRRVDVRVISATNAASGRRGARRPISRRICCSG